MALHKLPFKKLVGIYLIAVSVLALVFFLGVAINSSNQNKAENAKIKDSISKVKRLTILDNMDNYLEATEKFKTNRERGSVGKADSAIVSEAISKIKSQRDDNKGEVQVSGENFKPVKSILDINGEWLLDGGSDVIFFDSYNRVIKWNSGPEMKMDFIDATNRPDYPKKEFYVYGTIGSTKIFRTRILINKNKKKIYLDRVDGGVSNYYYRVSN